MEAKHLQLSTGQIDRCSTNSTNDTEKCSSSNTSLNSTISSNSSTYRSKIKSSPIKLEEYPSNICYQSQSEDYSYVYSSSSSSSSTVYPNTYSSSPSCYSTLNSQHDPTIYSDYQEKKRFRLDYDSYSSSSMTPYYSYPSEHTYYHPHPPHSTSVIVDNQQYLLNGWNNGTTAAF